jgi:HD superfamily phosphohydrolase YqeK
MLILMKVPEIHKAEQYIEEASKLNPGSWIEHSKYVAAGARLIAEKCSNLSPDIAYVLGLLHDIGRHKGKSQARHCIDGYNFMKSEGYEDCARICMTHTFQYKDVNAIYDFWDCSADELDTVRRFLDSVEYNDYDLLIQLSDAMSTDTGFCILERKMVKSAIRFGVKDILIKKWESTLKLKEYFDNKAKCSVYSLLPGIAEI